MPLKGANTPGTFQQCMRRKIEKFNFGKVAKGTNLYNTGPAGW